MAHNIEEKLKEYRRKKEAEIQVSSTKSIWEKVFPCKGAASTSTYEITNKNVAAGFESSLENISKGKASEVVTHKEGASDSSAQGELIPDRLRFREKIQSPKAMKQQQSKREMKSEQWTQNIPQLATDNQSGEFRYLLLFLKIILWLVLYLLCLELEFGALYVISSAFYIIFTNFRNGQRKPWEPSAYSVFNPGCEAIDGTLKPEQFEREIRYGF